MNLTHKLNQIRSASQSTTKQKVFAIIKAMIIGVLLGLGAKLVDTPNFNPIFDNIGGRLGIWVFVATLLSVFSSSPKLAAVKIFAFFGSMLAVYYVYTVLVLHFFPRKEIIFWGICALVSPVCAYLMWYARGKGMLPTLISAFPITALLTEGFELRHAFLPIHTHYYLIPYLMGIYLIMILILLFNIPKKKMQFMYILPIALILSIITIYFNIFGLIFGGMNGFL
ncbi:hypothetical protein [Paenibacillus sp. GCM10012306]|uniref:hypothetical protein n=1 Tax=Paenibacillus sp. GCM10012306 TaxID=3317342 RepID=UPI00360E0343